MTMLVLRKVQGLSEEVSLEKNCPVIWGQVERAIKAWMTVTRNGMGTLLSLFTRVIRKTSLDQVLSNLT